MKHIFRKFYIKTAALVLIAVVASFIAGIFCFYEPALIISFSSPTIQWTPKEVEQSIFPGTVKIISAIFTSNKDLKNVKFWLTPRLSKYAVVEPESINKVEKGKEYSVQIIISLSSEIKTMKNICEQLKDLPTEGIDKDERNFVIKCHENKIRGLLFITSEKSSPWDKLRKKNQELRMIHPKALRIVINIKKPTVGEIPVDEVSLPTIERIYEDEETGAVYVRDEVVIRFRESTSESRVKEIISAINGGILGHISDIEIYQVLVPVADPSELEPIIQQLETYPEVIIATYHWMDRIDSE